VPIAPQFGLAKAIVPLESTEEPEASISGVKGARSLKDGQVWACKVNTQVLSQLSFGVANLGRAVGENLTLFARQDGLDRPMGRRLSGSHL